MKRYIYLLVLTLINNLPSVADSPFQLKRLQVEYAVTPLGIDVENPRFSWQMEGDTDERGLLQTARQIVVIDEAGVQVWDSKKITDDQSLNIEYAGLPLKAATRYQWTVHVWDTKHRKVSASSWFETGLMSSDRAYEGWGGAKWIGAGDEDRTFYSHYLPVFKLNFSLRLDETTRTTCSGFIYGANDERLMERYKNLYQLENKKDESYIKVELNITPLLSGQDAVLNIYRVGYHPDDKKDIPYKSFAIPQEMVNEHNKYDWHTVTLRSNLGFTQFYVDNTDKQIGSVNLNPLGQGGDFIAFPVVGDVGYFVPAGQAASFSKVEIANFRSPANVITTLQDSVCRIVGRISDTFTTFAPESHSAPMLRTLFASSEAKIKKARLYVTSRGIYEVYLNGRRIGNDYFNPGITQYNKTHLYQTFDVTEYIHSGQNALGALLSEGWWSGGATFTGDISVFSRTATYLVDVPQFLRRYLRSMRDVQREDGRFPDIAPLGGGFGGLLWGSAGITVPWECYLQYGDKVLLAEHYDAMKRYISYILDKTIDPKTNLLVQSRAWGDLCDWLGLEDNRNDKSLLWEAYFIYDLELMSKIATILGKTTDAEEYRKLHSDRKAFFNSTYLQPETCKTIHSAFVPKKQGTLVDTQTSYVLPLVFGIIDEENKPKFVKNLMETIVRENRTEQGRWCPPYSLMTGFIGTAWISKALSDNGCSEAAYKLLQQTNYPSWLYSVEQGATTIWERLNSYTHEDGFGGNNRMNSFNHYSFGAVGAWMYNYSLGIERDENFPGFKHFVLKPEVDTCGNMTYAKGYYDSMYGRIESSWRVEEDAVIYQCTGNCSGNTMRICCFMQRAW